MTIVRPPVRRAPVASRGPLAGTAAAADAIAIAVAAPAALAAAPVASANLPTWASPALQLRSNIVDGFNLPPGSSFNSGTPALSDAGVAMRLLVVGDSGLGGVWRGPGDGTGEVVLEVGTDLLPSDVAFDAAGGLVFEVFDIFSEGIFRVPAAGPPADLLVAPGGPFGLDVFSDPRPAGPGTLVFRGGNFGGDRWIRWTESDGAQVSLVAENDPGIGFVFAPDADATGRAIGKVRLGSLSGDSPDEIRRYDAPGSFTVLAVDDDGDPDSPFSGFDNSVGATPDGRAAFAAGLAGGGRGVFLAGDAGIVTIATTDHPLVSDVAFFPPVANAGGVVAFRGTDADGLDAIFVGDGRTLVRLVGEHDLVQTDLGLARIDQNDDSPTFGGAPAIDADGSVAFAATLTPPDDDQVEWGTGVFVARATTTGDPADLNGDGAVDLEDLLAVISAFGTSDPAGDANGDGTVDLDDLLAVLAAWTG